MSRRFRPRLKKKSIFFREIVLINIGNLQPPDNLTNFMVEIFTEFCFTYVFKLKANGKGTFPSKVVSKPSKGNVKVNVTSNVQSLVILGIKNRLCRDNNRESDSKSIKD